MQTFAVYVTLRAEAPFDDPTVAVVEQGLRPHDDEMCVWRDERDDRLLCVATDAFAEDHSSAVDVGRVVAQEALALAGVPARVRDIVSMTEESQLAWSPG